MDSHEAKSCLAEIPTLWDQVREAQTGTGPAAAAAVQTLFQRYGGAVRRYLRAILGDAAAADDLTQEFALALVEGKIRRAHPKLGRFRDYLKGLLFHLVAQHRRRQKKWTFLTLAGLGRQAAAAAADSWRPSFFDDVYG